MKRSLDPAPFNRIANDPDIRPWLGFGLGYLDLAEAVTNPFNHCLLTPDGDGGYILAQLQPGLYAAHTLALPPARGKPMLTLMRDGFAYMFTATDALEIVTTVPDGNDAGDRWANIAGFRETFRREGYFPLRDQFVGASVRSVSYGEWVMRHAPNRHLGQAFHARLHGASEALAIHPEDPVHDAFVGATIMGVRAGQTQKAIGLFNRWAAQAGYSQATILAEKPPVIDTGDAILGLWDGEVQILNIKASQLR